MNFQQKTISLFFVFGLAACSNNDGVSSAEQCKVSDGLVAGAPSLIDKAVLENYTDNVVVPTYKSLAANAGELKTAAIALKNSPTEESLSAMQAAWVAARIPWEQSEGFLFGPVDANAYDPALDTWPLNKTDLETVLTSNAALTSDFVATLDDNNKGFHTIEYLIFGEDSQKKIAAFTAREYEYMIAASENLQNVATLLVNSWTEGVDGAKPFRETFVTAGEAGNTVYPSISAAGQEIINGLIGIAEEVADAKIANPFDAQDPNLVESQFSFNSLQDFSDNMRGIENSWKGAAPDQIVKTGTSLSDRIGSHDPELNTCVTTGIQNSIDAILEIPSPFPKSMLDPLNATVITKAQEQIRLLRDTLLMNVLPLTK